LANREFYDMFRDEARICATIRHPNVVPVTDVVEADKELFLVLDYVESLSLSALLTGALDRGERLPPPILSRIFADTLAGLHAAHEAVDIRGNRLELIHRDVSPQNIIVGLDGTSRLIDFGIAKAESRMSVTTSGVVKGKLRYMSPEQVRHQPLDRRSDIFAAGVVLFEALTGQRLFAGDCQGDVVLEILLHETSAPSTQVPEIPPELDEVVARALARKREERFQTAAEFQEALERALPPASPREVARIVEQYGGEKLEERRAELQVALDGVTETDVDIGRVGPGPTPTLVPKSIPQGGGPARTLIRAGVTLAVVAAVAGAFVLGVRKQTAAPGQAAAPDAVSRSVLPLPAAAPAPVPSSASLAEQAPGASSATLPAESSARPHRADHVRPVSDLHRRNPYGAP
jgi:serine/threonine-protein kinase